MKIEIFACSGGLAAGFRAAGIEFDATFDKDPDACDSYEANLGQRPVQMDVHDLLRMVRGGWRPLRLELLVADPPCTPWSRAGKRQGLDDERDMLAETVELIRLLRPAAYLIGNIPGLQDAPSWPVVQRLIGGLARDGYCVVDFVALDAADYGVPQHRIRPFWFGHLDGPCIRWPAPTHGDPAAPAALPGLSLRPWATCREALQHLPMEQLGRPVRMKIRPNQNRTATQPKIGSDETRCSSPDRPAATVVSHASSKGGQIIVIPAAHRANRLDEPSQTMGAKVRNVGSQVLDFTEPPRERTRDDRAPRDPQSTRVANVDAPSPTIDAREARSGSGNATLAWPWERPATTLTADPNGRLAPPGRRPAEGIGSIMSDPNAIVLSERAAGILQGFPDGWTFAGATKRARWSQIGQAVPPVVGEAIGAAVRAQLAATARGLHRPTDRPTDRPSGGPVASSSGRQRED